MSLTVYIVCTLPLLVMVAIAFVTPRGGDTGGPADGERRSTSAPPVATRPRADDLGSATPSDHPERTPVEAGAAPR